MPYRPSTPAPSLLQPTDPPLERPRFTRYTRQNDSDTEDRQHRLVNQVLDDPETMDAQTIAQLKARNKEQAIALANQTKANQAAQLASSGYTPDSGVRAAADTQVDMGTVNSILSRNRDIDVAARTTNRQDALNALQAAEQFLNSRHNRSTDAYRTTLLGEQTQADSDFRIADFNENTRRFNSDYGLRQWTAQQAAEEAAAESLFREITGLHDMTMDLRGFFENQRQFDDRLGLDYNIENNRKEEKLFDYLMGVFG